MHLTMNLLNILGKTKILAHSLDDVREMYGECIVMFDLAWDALENGDRSKAETVVGKDEAVDRLEVKVREEVLTYLESMPAGGNVPLSLILIDTANQLERLADHVTFIADSAMKYPCLDGDRFSEMLRGEKEISHSMLKNVYTALDACDESAAERVVGMYDVLKGKFEDIIRAVDESDMSPHRAVGLVLVSRDLLRIGKKSKSIMEFCLKPYPEAGE
ncbi:MAG: hypothetical protein GF416_08550 [Candidatus Altiarchaeales archaeon]|nr:hypothetical protein [Candidatus Altiarchaeales archaeon]